MIGQQLTKDVSREEQVGLMTLTTCTIMYVAMLYTIVLGSFYMYHGKSS